MPIVEINQYEEIQKIEENQSKSCTFCNLSFLTNRASKNHAFLQHLKAKYRCLLCLELLNSDKLIRDHLIKVHDLKPAKQSSEKNAFYCSFCGKSCKTNRDLIVHEARVHDRQGEFFCEVCGKFFATSGEERKHKRRKHSDLYEKCLKCNTICLEELELKTHLCKAAYSCKGCDSSFSSADLLYKHERECSVNYICNFENCTRIFTSKNNLDKHLRRHKWKNGEFEFKFSCSVCSKPFFDNYHLRVHMKGHGSNTC